MRLQKYLLTFLLAFATIPATAQDPVEDAPDDSWISLSGTVVAPTADSFLLDYGEGLITVEMDDYDSYSDTWGLIDGDAVIVYGVVDDGLYEAKTIEAGSVYNQDLNTYFYANSADEEDMAYWVAPSAVILSQTTVRGTVTDVDDLGREFTLDTGLSQITVETDELGYNPLDDYGFQQIDEGDVVSATGTLDNDFLEGRVLEAQTLTTLSN